MSIENENNSIEIVITPKANCGVSYSINNEQPVRSTHIGAQPLFYMDFEESYEEEENFMEAFSEEFVDEALKASDNKYDQVAKHFNKGKEWREDLLKENLADITSGTSTLLDLDKALSILEKSRIGAEHYQYAINKGVKIEIDNTSSNVEYVAETRSILINSCLTTEDAVLLLARELRRFWQKDNGTLINPLCFHPDQAIVINRAQIADLNVHMVRVAWELQLANEKSVWENIEYSSLADIGRAYAREACTDFRTMNNGEAAQAGFEAWFLSERCRKADKVLIQQMLSEYNGYVFGEDSAASKNVAFKLLGKLGTQPYGKNYLEPYANVILNDPVFTEVRDRSNANFLWFIKFERSFKEAEQELQSTDPENKLGLQDSGNEQSEENVFFINDGNEGTEQDIVENKVLQFKPRG